MKGISFIEQHVEKLVVALLAIVLVAVLAMQFLTSPNRVAMDRQEVNPGEIAEVLRAKADSINLELKGSENAPPLVDGGIPKVANDFLAGLDRGVSPRQRLPQIDHALAKGLLPGDVSSGDATYHVPRFEPLAMIEVRQESATIKPAVVSSTPGLADVLPDGGGSDVTWSIPVAKVDLKSLRTELRASPGDSVAIPELWYNGNLYLVDLVFERQELGADGWSDPALVPPLPGAFSLRKELGKADAVLRDEVFRLLASRERALAILQPDFVETEREVFTPGSILGDAGGADAGESDEIRRLRARLGQKTANLSRIEADLKELGGPLRGPDDKDRKKDGKDSDDGDSGGGGGMKTPGGGMGFGSGTAGGKRGTSGSTPEDEATRAKRRLLTGQLDRLSAEVERLTKQLKELAPDAAGVTASGKGSDLADSDSLLVWGHDLGVRPGATYRYRSRLEIFNPFFARKRQLSSKQADLADAFTLRTAVSEWSQPVTIEPEVTFFLVDAGPGEGRLGLGAAKFEVFRYEEGERRRETFVVQPGERIGDRREAGQDKREVDFGTDWFVVDVVEGLPGDGRDDSKGRNARVLVSDGRGRTVFRTAASDLGNSLRRKFNDDVETARLEGLVSNEPESDASGTSAPPMTPAGGPGAPGAN